MQPNASASGTKPALAKDGEGACARLRRSAAIWLRRLSYGTSAGAAGSGPRGYATAGTL